MTDRARTEVEFEHGTTKGRPRLYIWDEVVIESLRRPSLIDRLIDEMELDQDNEFRILRFRRENFSEKRLGS